MKLATDVIEQAVPQLICMLAGWLLGRAKRAVRSHRSRAGNAPRDDVNSMIESEV